MRTSAAVGPVGNVLRFSRTLAMVLGTALSFATAGCISTPMAPGSEQVKITRIPAEVANCKVLGNLDQGQENATADSARNHAVGLGGDTVLDTTPTTIYGTLEGVRTGIIYNCALR